MANPTERVTGLWRRLAPIPGGSWLFSRILGFIVPYTATIGAHVRELRPGYARVTLRDRRRVRNHLNSIHAVALVNLGEVTSGLAMIAALPPGTKSIVTSLSIEYLKKARGTLVAVGTTDIPTPSLEETEHLVQAEIRDAGGDVVARISVRWNLRSSDQ